MPGTGKTVTRHPPVSGGIFYCTDRFSGHFRSHSHLQYPLDVCHLEQLEGTSSAMILKFALYCIAPALAVMIIPISFCF